MDDGKQLELFGDAPVGTLIRGEDLEPFNSETLWRAIRRVLSSFETTRTEMTDGRQVKRMTGQAFPETIPAKLTVASEMIKAAVTLRCSEMQREEYQEQREFVLNQQHGGGTPSAPAAMPMAH